MKGLLYRRRSFYNALIIYIEKKYLQNYGKISTAESKLIQWKGRNPSFYE